ncbi:MAG TPA: DUF1501 domain-containing protein [Usitatibacter sp.]|jgi:uncharacterized protein (DUF1501 family)|nr:DUF1501 domain-containing protein [Usitatibacter sp.]
MSANRRAFLRLATLAPVALSWPALARAAPQAGSRGLLILVELKGGNDGLNTVIPYADPAYAALRPRVAIGRDQVVQLTERTGLHPSLVALKDAWDAHELAIVQGVGYPQPNLSHFRSIEIWDTASRSDEYLDSGWIARAFARAPRPASLAADGVVIGNAGMGPLAGPGLRALSLATPEQFLRSARLARDEEDATRNAALAHILKVERDVVASARRIVPSRTFAQPFPPGPFGSAVNTAAQLAANPSGVAVVHLSLGSFDTHANQLGQHANLLRQLGEGLAALRGALKEIGRWDSTVIATYSEFGRRPRENLSAGTDHGTASAQFVLGGAVKGGLHGEPPALDRLDANGNLPFAVDFRSCYAALLRHCWDIPARGVFDGNLAALPIFEKSV